MRGRRIVAGIVAVAAISGMAGGCSRVDGTAVSTPTPSVSPVDRIAREVRASMQNKLTNDPELSRFDLEVIGVDLVHKNGNEYKGIAQVKTAGGKVHDVPIDVTADGDDLIWEAGPGAFLFALRDAPAESSSRRPAPPPAPMPPPPPPVAPVGGAPLPLAADGRVYVATKSGKTRCRLSTFEVACQAPFIDAPLVYGQPANGITFTANGALTYVVGDLGSVPATVMGYDTTYRALSWRVDATGDGTTFTHAGTGRSVFVSITSVQVN